MKKKKKKRDVGMRSLRKSKEKSQVSLKMRREFFEIAKPTLMP